MILYLSTDVVTSGLLSLMACCYHTFFVNACATYTKISYTKISSLWLSTRVLVAKYRKRRRQRKSTQCLFVQLTQTEPTCILMWHSSMYNTHTQDDLYTETLQFGLIFVWYLPCLFVLISFIFSIHVHVRLIFIISFAHLLKNKLVQYSFSVYLFV